MGASKTKKHVEIGLAIIAISVITLVVLNYFGVV